MYDKFDDLEVFLLTVPRPCFFCGSFLLVMLQIVCVMLLCLFLLALWSPDGKGLTSWLSCLMSFVSFPNVCWSTSELRARLAP